MTRQQAINAKCKDCIYDPLCGGGTWRQQVQACSISTCALWPYRPKARVAKPQESSVNGAGEMHARQTLEAIPWPPRDDSNPEDFIWEIA